jgi:hypothetical protein
LTRRQLLWTFFEELDVEGGNIVAIQPRREVEAEVIALLDGWRGFHGVVPRLRVVGQRPQLPTPEFGADPDSAASSCGPCGLRTRDLRLERPAS